MIVVSNTSPITNLAAIGQLDLLRQLFGRVVVPGAVVQELNAGGIAWPGSVELVQADWIRAEDVAKGHLVDALRLDLDHGEAAAIVLALQTGATLVLLDEQTGRAAARYLGLEVMGVVGILLRAKQRGYIPRVKPLLDMLRHQAGFFLSAQVYEHALGLAQE
jgi:predicted nucleic acid-binding protein